MFSSVRFSLLTLAVVLASAAPAQEPCGCPEEEHPQSSPLPDDAVVFTARVSSQSTVEVLRGIVGDTQGEMMLRRSECDEELTMGDSYLFFGRAYGAEITLDYCQSPFPLGRPPKTRSRKKQRAYENRAAQEEVVAIFLAGRWALARAHVEMLSMDPRLRRVKKDLKKTAARLDTIMKAHAEAISELDKGQLRKARVEMTRAERAGSQMVGGRWRDQTLRDRIERFKEATGTK